MALGFGFNKAKVLAQAEKFVQQGKLSNAVSEYEKVLKEDPKDSTVLNTVGDLYARMGNNDQATYYFKRVGDQYAQNGFTLKAIAIYKKLTKMSSYNAENTIRLAELYGQQGLFNDARVHYMMVADQLLKSNDNNQAARIFQKILELDPENAHTQAKLADLYTKLGKRDEARNIYYSAAESLYARGSHAAAEEALEKVLSLDPANTGALMLRGLIAVDAGDSEAAVRYLEQISDLDARPDGLRALLRAKLQTGSSEGVDSIAGKLLARHNDVTGVTTLAQWYATNNHIESALRLYETNAERMFAGNQAALQEALAPLTGRAKDNPAAMAILNRLLNQTGDQSQTAEMMEQQAHAAAQKGSYAEARDLYKQLTEMEPENAHHAQNYKQMLVKLGEDSATRILTPEEAAQAFMVEELDETAPPVHQAYDPPTEKAIESALTDAELYVSYNVPSKAIPPLEAALPLAPQDVNLNQRLASLYVRSERFAEAAKLYQNLSDIYKELGHPTESAKYLEASKRYALRAPQSAPAAAQPQSQPKAAKATWPPLPPVTAAPVPPPSPAPVEVAAEAEPSVQEFSFDTPDVIAGEPEAIVAAPVEPIIAEPVVSEIPLEPVHFTATPAAHAEPSSPPPPAEEIDISNEWEEMIEVEPVEQTEEVHVQSAQETAAETPVRFAEPGPAAHAQAAEAGLSSQITDKVQEIRFYITQGMWESAKSAILDLTELAPDAPEVTELIAAVSAGQSRPSAEALTPAFVDEPAVAPAEIPKQEIPKPKAVEPAPPPPVAKPKVAEPAPPPVVAKPQAVEPPPPIVQKPKVETPKPIEPPSSPVHVEKKPVVQPAAIAHEDVLDIPEPPKAKPAPARAAPTASSKSTEDILGDFVLDLEQSPELADFAPKQHSAHAPAPAPTAAPASVTVDRRISSLSNGDMQDKESADVLNDILSELQEETAEAAEPEEDPETHYNLGIAFKEMGLLDEAIGELQKVCHAVDRGAKFSQPIQALTWLAQCLVDKGAPEAAVRWYQKALHLPGLDDSSRCAIYYDLAMAFEASGDKKSALANFMEVYGSNIDFRDVASRIKALKS
ncbi:MAG TPA: tetratricopeptide repeat protein [Candidatus Angelobacter sp.]|nr:tetratricopeptide repeat protein [Candidatus Angelobacter sp.]